MMTDNWNPKRYTASKIEPEGWALILFLVFIIGLTAIAGVITWP